ncbi:MAG TPA: TlpA disulfide reductase family protein [Candidatus Cybelea sp.]|nr:TlpA disulfide reductase family protein [Candidatus Cybelea sp.]
MTVLVSALTGAGVPSPGPRTVPKRWDECAQNPGLPYDRPLGLTMRVLDGPDFDLIKYRGRAVLINIFATWCGPCNGEMPYVVEAEEDFASRGLSVVGIDAREEDDTVRAFRKRYDITFPIAMDRNGTFVKVLEVGANGRNVVYPVSLFVDPNGFLTCDVIGAMGRRQLRYRIERSLATSAPAIATPAPASTPLL